MIVMSSLATLFFLGGWHPFLSISIFYWFPPFFWFGCKIAFFLFLFIWVRAAFPRYRYDQLMRLGWKIYLPQSLAWVLFVSGLLIGFDWLPN
jgi:NADH:ubiquinone oxidoreductase subunit H